MREAGSWERASARSSEVMAEINAALVKKLRDATGAGMMECKAALTEAKGDIEEATTILRKRGLAQATKKAGRSTNEGLIGSYIHMGGKIGVLVEVNCESDFVARTDDFQSLAREIAMHIAAASPQYVRREDVPADVLERERGDLPRPDGRPEQAGRGDREDRRRQAEQLLRAGLPARSAVDSRSQDDHRPDRPGGDRQDGREHRRRRASSGSSWARRALTRVRVHVWPGFWYVRSGSQRSNDRTSNAYRAPI